MHLPSLPVALAALCLMATTTSAVKLVPWQVRSLGTYSPSGRPGSTPFSSLSFTILDNNTVDTGPVLSKQPSEIKCRMEWSSRAQSDDEPPPPKDWFYGVVNDNCTAVDNGRWTFRLLKAGEFECAGKRPSATTCFNLEVTQAVRATAGRDEGDYEAVLVGRAHFETGVNMVGMCAGSGFCNWALADDAKPFYVAQEFTNCRGICGED